MFPILKNYKATAKNENFMPPKRSIKVGNLDACAYTILWISGADLWSFYQRNRNGQNIPVAPPKRETMENNIWFSNTRFENMKQIFHKRKKIW